MSVEQLLKDVDTEIKAADKAIAMIQESHAPLFKTIDFMGIKKETKLSEIFAFLMKSDGSHGQGTKYLKLFLDMLFQKYEQFPRIIADQAKKIDVRTEVRTTGDRRADFIVTIDNFMMLFENKPWAADGDKQISDYADHIKGREAAILYICDDDPEENSISKEGLEELRKKDQFFRISFSEIASWIKSCIQDTRPDKVRSFLYEFYEFLESEFMNTKVQTNQKIIDLISENIASSFEIHKNLIPFKKKLLMSFLDDLKRELDRHEIMIDFGFRHEGKTYGIEKFEELGKDASFSCYRKSTFAQRMKYAVRFAFSAGDLNDLIWGVSKLDDKFDFTKEPGLAGKIKDELNKKFPNILKTEEKITSSTWWPWRSNASQLGIPDNWGSDPAVWERMNLPYEDEKSIVRIVVENAKMAVEALENIQA